MEGDREKRFKVLIVDDVPENIHILMETLKDEFSLVAATGGEKALRLARGEAPPDLILLDVMMPGMGGYEVCTHLKADPKTAPIPVVFLTALSQEEDEAQGLKLGAVDYVTKPFRPALVKARVRNQLELKHHRDRLEDAVRDRTRELELTREVIIDSLAAMAERRDLETGGHIQRTRRYVQFLAERAASHPDFAGVLSPETIALFASTAPLHDIGKVGIPDGILLKPGKLTDEEFRVMGYHTLYGYEILRDGERRLRGNTFLSHAQDIARDHHERWDGKGYLRGLAGEEIPLSARIMTLADVYDALVSRRPYKEPFPHHVAMEIIAEGRGTRFDPRLVDIFLASGDAFFQIFQEHADDSEGRPSGDGGEMDQEVI
ncbi:MAG TPA: response regulator [Synergistaceae bacterium]|nr:response regulator [Synergistaceae bacterium]HQH77373.1 response regulator [Synergistaceae bacterium]